MGEDSLVGRQPKNHDDSHVFGCFYSLLSTIHSLFFRHCRFAIRRKGCDGKIGSTVTPSNRSSHSMSTASFKTMPPSSKSPPSCTALASSQNRKLTRKYLNEKKDLSDRKLNALNILRAKFLDCWFEVHTHRQAELLAGYVIENRFDLDSAHGFFISA